MSLFRIRTFVFKCYAMRTLNREIYIYVIIKDAHKFDSIDMNNVIWDNNNPTSMNRLINFEKLFEADGYSFRIT